MKYNAFISYRHNDRDTLVASALQTQLERFHIPKAIRERTGIKKIDRIFRDQNELELTNDLGGDIDEALEQSDFLIVILSPAYNESKWCLHEIDQFLKTHDSSHIMAVLSEGEPPGIFPDQLMHKTITVTDADGTTHEETVDTEPLACDYRMDLEKAKRIELPRLVSGMLGCEYDELVLRNETYRRNRLLALFGIIAAIGAAAIAWLLYSNARISENFRQSQINESKTIASGSLEELSAGNRLNALIAALSALPSETEDRPVTSEALYALSQASLAYELPYHLKQLGLIDLTYDVRLIRSDEDRGLLYLIDDTDTVSIYRVPLLEKVTEYSMGGVTNDWIPTFQNGNLVAWTSHGAVCYSPKGVRLWDLEMNYEVYGTAVASSDGTLCAISDMQDVVVVDGNGTPLYSLRVPQDVTDSIVYDMAWSADDSKLAVLLKSDSDTYEMGMFDTGSGRFSLLGQTVRPDAFRFVSEEKLVMVSCSADSQTFSMGTYDYLYRNAFDVVCATFDGVLWSDQIITTSENVQTEIHTASYGDISFVLVNLSNKLTYFDPESGEVLDEVEVDSPVLSVFDVINDSLFLITANGRHGTHWIGTNEMMMESLFVDHISAIEVYHGLNAVLNQYAVLQDGNVYWYSCAFDDELQVFSGEGTYYTADEGVFSKDTAAVRINQELILYDLNDKREITRIACGEDEVILLSKTDRERDVLALLRVNISSGETILELRSMQDLSVLHTIPLAHTDYYAQGGVYDMIYQSFQTMQYHRVNLIASDYYLSPSVVAVSEDDFFYMEENTAPILHRIHIPDGSETTIPLLLPEGYSAKLNGKSTETPVFTLSEDGKTAMLILKHSSSGYCHAAFLNTETGEITLNEAETVISQIYAENSTHTRSVFCALDGLILLDGSRNKIAEIPYPGSTCIGLKLVGDRLFAVYASGILYEYDASGNEVNHTTLSFSETDQFTEKEIRMSVSGDSLLVFEREGLDFIPLNEASSRPSACVPARVLNYSPSRDSILIYSYDGTARTADFFPGLLPHYSTEALIRKAEKELAGN